MLALSLPQKYSVVNTTKKASVVERIRRRTIVIQQIIQGEVEKPQTLTPQFLQMIHERNDFLKAHPQYLKYGITLLMELVLQKCLKLLNFEIAFTIVMRERKVDYCFSFS